MTGPAPSRPAGARGLSRFLVPAASPTADLYFRWSCADLIAAGRAERLAPTVFRHGDTVIALRHASGLRGVPGGARLILLVDDDIGAGIGDRAVPLGYRLKLSLIEAPAERRLAPAADVVLAASDALAERFSARAGAGQVERIEPAWPDPPEVGANDHGPVRMACLAARSHAGDFRWIAPVLERLLALHPELRLTLSGNLPVPRSWFREPQVEVVPVMGWADYRHWMRSRRFHIGLYPLVRGGMNRARSSSKLGEYAQFGAAVVASDSWPAGVAAAGDGRCLVLPDDPAAWEAVLGRLIGDRAGAAALARRNRDALIGQAPLRAQRALWNRILGPGGAAQPGEAGA